MNSTVERLSLREPFHCSQAVINPVDNFVENVFPQVVVDLVNLDVFDDSFVNGRKLFGEGKVLM